MKKLLWIAGGLILLAAIGNMMPGTVPGQTTTANLTPEQLAHIDKAHASHAWFRPTELEIRNGVVVATYEVPEGMIIPHRKFAEDRLLAIREELLGDGFTSYRVNVNGPPPGTGLVRRYGSATFYGSGKVDWSTP